MTRRRSGTALGSLAAAALSVLLSPSPAIPGPVTFTYLYDLADFTGTIPYNNARTVVDAPRSEVYTIYANEIRVFNKAGMEIYRFEVDPREGRVLDLALEPGGDMLILMYAPGEGTPSWVVSRADFRGRPAGEVPIDRSGALSDFLPNRILLRSGRIWLLSESQMRAVACLPDGTPERILDLAELGALPEEDRGNAEIGGFDVGADGTVVFAVPVQFRVHAIDPGGGVRSFGKSGSAAGNFGVIGDVALDGDGNIFVSDRQRSVVMAFDRGFRFLAETAGVSHRDLLVRPGALAFDQGRLYVSQLRGRGVAVFAVTPAP